jgi:hypothetical protein
MIRGDLKSRADALAVMRQNGVINSNEWREWEELDPLTADQGGDQYIVTSQSRPANEAADPPDTSSGAAPVTNRPTMKRHIRDSVTGMLLYTVETPISRRQAKQMNAEADNGQTPSPHQSEEDRKEAEALRNQLWSTRHELQESRTALRRVVAEKKEVEQQRDLLKRRVPLSEMAGRRA